MQHVWNPLLSRPPHLLHCRLAASPRSPGLPTGGLPTGQTLPLVVRGIVHTARHIGKQRPSFCSLALSHWPPLQVEQLQPTLPGAESPRTLPGQESR